jgi:hypothetical protein
MFSRLKNLNDAWVIVSRHNGNVFFKRSQHATRLKNYPDESCLYYDKYTADKSLEALNATRKKCKFQLENASKYFVNSFETNSWSGRFVLNKPVPIKNVQENKVRIKDSSKIKDSFIEDINHSIKRSRERIAAEQSDILRLELELKEVMSTDFHEKLKSYETQGDRIVKVLFMEKEKT